VVSSLVLQTTNVQVTITVENSKMVTLPRVAVFIREFFNGKNQRSSPAGCWHARPNELRNPKNGHPPRLAASYRIDACFQHVDLIPVTSQGIIMSALPKSLTMPAGNSDGLQKQMLVAMMMVRGDVGIERRMTGGHLEK
jgi:hypothetical protein